MARGRSGGRGGSRGKSHVASASYRASRSSGASSNASKWAARGSAAAYGRSGTKDAAAAGAYKASRAHGGSKSDAKAAARGAAAAYDQMHGKLGGEASFDGIDAYYPVSASARYEDASWHQQRDEFAERMTWPTHIDSNGRMYCGLESDEKYYVGTDWKEVYEKGADEEQNRGTGLPKNEKKSGCYIATCVYGSYDCPEVRILRQFRDTRLLSNAPGSLFVKVYYAISPRLVEKYGDNKGFRKVCGTLLDWLVNALRKHGLNEGP